MPAAAFIGNTLVARASISANSSVAFLDKLEPILVSSNKQVRAYDIHILAKNKCKSDMHPYLTETSFR
jgi:hypothetical protein